MTAELAPVAGQGQADQALSSLSGLEKEAQGHTKEGTLSVARPSELPSLAPFPPDNQPTFYRCLRLGLWLNNVSF